MKDRILCVGAGLTGSVIARELAGQGLSVTVIDERAHVAGNCHSRRDPETGIMVHVYGPHIFHTSDAGVWDYVNRFSRFHPYINRIRAAVHDEVYPLPINLATINQFFGKNFTPEEAQDFIENVQADRGIKYPRNFEEHALRHVGRSLYEAFFKGYTLKQWEIHPRNLPAAILQRLPVRYTADDNYYNDTFQGIPEDGYTVMVQRILDHPGIRLELGTRFEEIDPGGFLHVFYSGRLDRYFGYRFGSLGYRTLKFEEFHPLSSPGGDFQSCALMNFCDIEVPYTRITEHKHFAPWESHRETVCTREYSRTCGSGDIPFYPVRLAGSDRVLERYLAESGRLSGTTLVGRLGTHRYLDMHRAVSEALAAARHFLENRI